jgi:hypothetical protein
VLIFCYGRLYTDETRPWNRETFTDHFKLEGLGPTVCSFPSRFSTDIHIFAIQVVGSPSTVADEMQRWVDEGNVDGFSPSPPSKAIVSLNKC